MRLLLILAALCALAGCDRSEPRPGSAAEVVTLAEARVQLAHYRAAVAALEEQAAAERIEAHRRWLSWAMGIAIAGALLCAALAMVLPVGRKTLITAALACVGTVVAAYLLGQVLAWLPVLGVLAALLALGWLVWALWLRLRCAIRTVDIVADKQDPSWEPLADHVRHLQGGLQKEMKRLMHRVGGTP